MRRSTRTDTAIFPRARIECLESRTELKEASGGHQGKLLYGSDAMTRSARLPAAGARTIAAVRDLAVSKAGERKTAVRKRETMFGFIVSGEAHVKEHGLPRYDY